MAVRLCMLALLVGGASAASVTPIEKVLQMMNALVAKGETEKKEEAVKFAAFEQWCEDQTRTKGDEIAAADDKIDSLAADIEKSVSTIKELTARIEELDEDVGRWQKDQKAATAVREKETLDFTATVQDYSESFTALGNAIKVMKGVGQDTAQSALLEEALIQVSSKKIVPAKAKTAISMFLQLRQQTHQPDADMPDDQLFIKAPEANAYDSQSSGVVDMLEKLEDQFRSEKTNLEKEEMGAQNAFEKIMQQLADNIENAEHEISKKTKTRAETEEAKAVAEGEKASTTTDRDEDKKYVGDLQGLCSQKKDDFAARQQLRGEELAAIGQAIDIIGSDKVQGAGEKNLPQLIQLRAKHSTALAQVQRSQLSPLQQRLAAFLSEKARSSGSKVLSAIAVQVAGNPFGKVKKMIQDLVIKLQEESTSEIEHKGWCDTELGTNKQTRDKKTEDINMLSATVDDLTAEIAELTQSIADLAIAIKELEDAMAAETEDRFASKEKNEQTIDEAKVAQTAVTSALALLKDFYAKSAQATAFAQSSGPADDAPETFDEPFKGSLPEGGSITDFLEVVLSDFARLESETTAAEATEQEEYENFLFESKKDKALKENEQGHKEAKKTDQEGALHATKEELKATSDELAKAVAYYDKLKPTCVDSGISYEERVTRREEEMQSLQEALGILSGSDIA